MTDQTGGAKEQAHEVVSGAKETAQEQAGQVAEKGRGLLRGQLDQRSTQAGGQAQALADALRQTASQMRAGGDPQQAQMAGFADQGADRLERVGGYLTRADGEDILGKVEDTARRQPWLIAGGCLLLGIAAARVMKASSSERYQRYSSAEYGRRQPMLDRPARVPQFEYEATPIGSRPALELDRA
jgi:vacuolar-type H+-ATPase subunit H